MNNPIKKFASINEVKYIIISKRQVKKGEKGLPPLTPDESRQYNMLRRFIGLAIGGLNFRKEPKAVVPIILAVIKLISKDLPFYQGRLLTKEEFRKNLQEFKDKFK